MKYINKSNSIVAFGRFRMEPGSMLVDPSFTPAELAVAKHYMAKDILSTEEETVATKKSEKKSESKAKEQAADK